jgi:hypothetical protein
MTARLRSACAAGFAVVVWAAAASAGAADLGQTP